MPHTQDLSTMTAEQLLWASMKELFGGTLVIAVFFFALKLLYISVDASSFVQGAGIAALWFFSNSAPVAELRRHTIEYLTTSSLGPIAATGSDGSAEEKYWAVMNLLTNNDAKSHIRRP